MLSMPICAVQLPVVRIFEDFDKMSAKEQQIAARIADDSAANTSQNEDTDDERVSIKFIAAKVDDRDYLSSTEEDPQSSPVRQRKRSNSNVWYRASRAFSECHGGATSSQSNFDALSDDSTSQSPIVNVVLSGGSGSSNISSCCIKRDGLRRQLLVRRSPSPTPNKTRSRLNVRSNSICVSPGYVQYQRSLLEVPMPRDYGEASSDDLSSEWDSDFPEPQVAPKVRFNYLHKIENPKKKNNEFSLVF